MISESRHWKAPLLRAAAWLERTRLTEASSERLLVRVERELFVGFYAIRKLLETFTLSPETKSLQLQLKWSPCIKLVDHFNSNRIDELFDLDTVEVERRDLGFVCNQFIHSFVFSAIENEDQSLFGFYIASDRSRYQKIYLVALSEVLRAFRAVGNDYPCSLHLQRNAETHQWEQVAGET